jgi:hypothetical protein
MRELSRKLKRHTTAGACLFALLTLAGVATHGQLVNDVLELEHPSFNYVAPARRNAVTRLSDRLADDQALLQFDPGSGYLRSLLKELAVPIESQITVFSAASLQGRLIRPSNPRAIFFNDSVTVGWVRGGFIEIAAHDAERGAVFFRLLQTPGLPTLFRENSCLGCHYSATTLGVPGFIARSIPTAVDGSNMPWLGNYQVDHRTAITDRWGGWYVTGRVGSPHLGNAPIADRRLQELPAPVAGPPLESLSGRFDTELFLSPHSDVVALLVFDHQQHMMNLLSRLNAEARVRPNAPLDAAAAEVVDYMLFVDEAPLGPVAGGSGFSTVFSASGRRDSKGRSLRDLDLARRLMRYPCSYMIYAEAFDGLPMTAKTAIYRRLKDVLEGRVRSPRYARLTAADRQAVLEILRETIRDF